ncbi:MAG TPA: hypothetical protein PLQ20_01845 [Candidatus Paceibacterota bacterium]|nr:hypothetical protein [Candidatus Paceibacterota bacterium]
MKSFVQKYYQILFIFLVLLVAVLSFVLGYQSASQNRVASYGDGIVFSCQEDVLTRQKVLGVQKDLSESATEDSQNQNSLDENSSFEKEKGAYVGSKNGTKYYTPGCPATNRIKPENYIWFQSIEDATLQGYTKGSC